LVTPFWVRLNWSYQLGMSQMNAIGRPFRSQRALSFCTSATVCETRLFCAAWPSRHAALACGSISK